MLDLDSYWMGRDSKYRSAWTEEIKANGAQTVLRINALVDEYVATTGNARPYTWASGWRPVEVNDQTSNAAQHSKHITAQAGDVRDNANRDFARWCNANQKRLVIHSLWMEDSRFCPTWVHLQCVPPMSARRVYVPSVSAPLCEMP